MHFPILKKWLVCLFGIWSTNLKLLKEKFNLYFIFLFICIFINQFVIYTLSPRSNDIDFVDILMFLEIVLTLLGPITSNLIVLRFFWKEKRENEYLSNSFYVPTSLCVGCLHRVFYMSAHFSVGILSLFYLWETKT